MEQRIVKMSKRKAGGTAGQDSIRYAIDIPTSWAKNISKNNGMVELSYDGEQIVVKQQACCDSKVFVKDAMDKGHLMREYHYMDKNRLCTKIYADFTAKQLCAENKTDSILDTAFGVNQEPTWEDLAIFFAGRCIPSTRAGLAYYLDEIGVNEYDPFVLVEKTQGRMAEDDKWLEIV
ncbi:MAG: hypothetical protein RR415_13020 [Ruthenibacterium sp.]